MKRIITGILLSFTIVMQIFAQQNKRSNYLETPRNPLNEVIRPKEIFDVLSNPGIGFMTFQRFNGDDNNPGSGWTEGLPIEAQPFDGDLTNTNHPATTIAYWRVYWYYFEQEEGIYSWDMLDQALETARLRGQTLILRIAPYGNVLDKSYNTDVPEWYRKMVGPKKEYVWYNWAVDPEDPRYVAYFTRMIKAIGDRYDGHPDLEAVDLSIIGPWGEGAGSDFLTPATMNALVDSYTKNFKKTPLIALLMDSETHDYAKKNIQVGWRVDCIGDLRTWAHEKNWSHMRDLYPIESIRYNLQDDWKTAPISFEICGTFSSWRDGQKITREEVKWIFDESLKWHISSFNAKSSPVPEEWNDLVTEWLNKMGYRYVIRRFIYPKVVYKNAKLPFYSFWENIGVAPCYKDFTLAVRLKSNSDEFVYISNAVVKEWLPGQFTCDESFFIPPDFPEGSYDIQVAIVDKQKHIPRVNLAIEGRLADGWYQIGKITVSGKRKLENN